MPPPLVRCLNSLPGCNASQATQVEYTLNKKDWAQNISIQKIIFVALPTNSSSLTSIHHIHGLLGNWALGHLVGPQESVLLNSWHQKSLKQGPQLQQYGDQITRTWKPESRDGGLYLGDGEHHRDRQCERCRGGKACNGGREEYPVHQKGWRRNQAMTKCSSGMFESLLDIKVLQNN